MTATDFYVFFGDISVPFAGCFWGNRPSTRAPLRPFQRSDPVIVCLDPPGSPRCAAPVASIEAKGSTIQPFLRVAVMSQAFDPRLADRLCDGWSRLAADGSVGRLDSRRAAARSAKITFLTMDAPSHGDDYCVDTFVLCAISASEGSSFAAEGASGSDQSPTAKVRRGYILEVFVPTSAWRSATRWVAGPAGSDNLQVTSTARVRRRAGISD